ncbi:MAG: hypothetical protein ABJF04_02725 [Reichenbachiella sp.]|uniref:hypothetical protein n=1 Tax=Reichenbachiella sp. TaxID=2184521 RepID=UPI0032664D3D
MSKRKIDIESLKKGNVHQIPDGYFDELPLKIQSRIDERISIEAIKKESIHQVPEQYFEELPLKIQTKINEQKDTAPVFVGRMQLAWIMTAAMSIFIIGWLFYPTGTDELTPDQILASIQSEDLIEYLYEENISTEDILASIDEGFLLDEMGALESEMIDDELSDEELESIYLEMDYSTEIM